MEDNLTGKCGLYCGACVIYRAEKDNPEKREMIAKKVNCAVEQVRCMGCGALTPECWCYGCKLLACLKTKGYDFCYQCPEFENHSCEKYNDLAAAYLEDGEDIRANLAIIKAGFLKEWLAEQDKKYRCKNCNHPISVSDQTCPVCKHQINRK